MLATICDDIWHVHHAAGYPKFEKWRKDVQDIQLNENA